MQILMMVNVVANYLSAPLIETSRSISVQLNLLHVALPHGLYGVVVDCSIPYVAYKCFIISLLKHQPWSL